MAPELKKVYKTNRPDAKEPVLDYCFWQWPDGRKSVDFDRVSTADEWLRRGWAKPQDPPENEPGSMSHYGLLLKGPMKALLCDLQDEVKVDWDDVHPWTILALRKRRLIEPGLDDEPWVLTSDGWAVDC